MGFREGSFAKVWKVENKGNYSVVEMSTSKKGKDGKYETDWSNKFVRLVGTAHKQAEKLQDGASVKIGQCEVTNNYDKEKKVTYTNYAIFNFHESDDNGERTATGKANTKPNTPQATVDMDDDLPF